MPAIRSSVSSRISHDSTATAQPSSVVAQSADIRPEGLSVSRCDYWVLTGLLSLSAVTALVVFYSRNEILLSGDMVFANFTTAGKIATQQRQARNHPS